MGKRLTLEEKEARLKAYEEAKAAKQAARLEKRKARIEAYEKAKEVRARKRDIEKRGIKAAELSETEQAKNVRTFPPFKGTVKVGDQIGFRFMGLALAGELVEINKERNYRIRLTENGEEELEESKEAYVEMYVVKENSTGVFYPIRKNDILAKKVEEVWVDNYNYKYYIKDGRSNRN